MLRPCYSPPTSVDARLVGDPVDTLTGAVFDRRLEFRLIGPLELRWYRHYDSSQSHRPFSLGWGRAHDFDRVLRFHANEMAYQAPVGRIVRFPPLLCDGDKIALNGFVLRRLSLRRYHLFHHDEPSMEFEFSESEQSARLKRLFQGQHEIVFHYDRTRRLERIVDSTGRHVRVVEGTDGRLISLTLESTRTKPELSLMVCTYDNFGNLISITDGAGHRYAFAYDKANRMVRQTGRKGFTFHFEYDSEGRCIGTAGDSGLYRVAIDYKVPGRLSRVTRGDGGVWTYFFNRAGGLTQILDPLGGVQKYLLDETGKIVAQLDQNQNVTRIVYDVAGEAVAKIDPIGRRISLPEDPNASPALAHRVAANPVEFEYGRLFDGEQVRLPRRESVRALPLSGDAKRLICVADGRAPIPVGSFNVPPLGAVWWPDPKLGRVFSDLGILLQQSDEFGRVRTWSYDPSGNVSVYTDFDGRRWSYDNGAWHLLLGLTNPLGAEVRFSYTSGGKVASCTDAGGTRSEYRYDLKDQLVEVKRHGIVRETYQCDACGNLLAKCANNNRELLRFEIGPGNRPIKRTLASGDEHSFQYDESGRYLVAATKRDFLLFAYDVYGNRVLENRNGQGVTNRFEGRQKRIESVIFNRFAIKFSGANDNTLVISDPGGKHQRIRFHSHGLVERRFSNGTTETGQYDSLKRCLFKTVERGDGSVWTRRFDWSGEGELNLVEDSALGNIRHEYDAAHRLCGRFGGGLAEQFRMDHADNLVHQPGLSEVTLQEGNRLETANGFALTYNDRNHIASRQTSTGLVKYTYDSRDQLVRVETPEGLWEADCDALGRRVRKTWEGLTTEFYWSSDQLVSEVYPDGHIRLYVYADPLALTPVLFLDYDSVDAHLESCRRYFIFSDQIGVPCLVENDNGAVVWSARLEPFGRAHISPGSKLECNLRFPGHYFDPELGLHYNRFRYYDPILGRYLQSDPWGIAGSFNLYAYPANPLFHVDVRGLGTDNKEPGEQAAEGGQDKESSNSAQGKGGADPSPDFKDVEGNQAPFKGEPNSTVRAGTQSRTYGPDGYPATNRDLPHPDEAGLGNQDHCHDWGRPPDGGPPIGPPGTKGNPYRGDSRPPGPGDPPPPRGPNVPPPESSK